MACFLDIIILHLQIKNRFMKALIVSLSMFLYCSPLFAQTSDAIFKGRLSNKEHQIYLLINFYESNITIPGGELFGELAGYLGDDKDSRKWLITDAKIKNDKTVVLSIINDYGSEDLTATLVYNKKDGTYILKQGERSCIKIVRNRKFVKLPKNIVFIKQ